MIQITESDGSQYTSPAEGLILTSEEGKSQVYSDSGGLNTTVEILAMEGIGKYQVVTNEGYLADSDEINERHKIVGVALDDTSIGYMIPVQVIGEIEEPTWTWSSGAIFLNSTVLSNTAPTVGFIKVIGTVLSSTKIFINLEESILL